MSGNQVKIFFDYTCPFCYIAKGMIDKVEKAKNVTPIWVPVEVHPSIPKEGVNFSEYYKNNKSISALYEYARNIGIDYDIEIKSYNKKFNTNRAILYSLYANDMGAYNKFSDDVFKMVFYDNKNIFTTSNIKTLLEGCNLDYKKANKLIENEYYQPVLNWHKYLVYQYSISTVPTFIINESVKIQGVHKFEDFSKFFS